MNFRNIESWASRIGYIVEESEQGRYVWYRENNLEFHNCVSVEDVIDQILAEIKASYVGGGS